jgi:hypothetical protein
VFLYACRGNGNDKILPIPVNDQTGQSVSFGVDQAVSVCSGRHKPLPLVHSSTDTMRPEGRVNKGIDTGGKHAEADIGAGIEKTKRKRFMVMADGQNNFSESRVSRHRRHSPGE